MTVIAWDGNILAADRQIAFMNLTASMTKIADRTRPPELAPPMALPRVRPNMLCPRNFFATHLGK